MTPAFSARRRADEFEALLSRGSDAPLDERDAARFAPLLDVVAVLDHIGLSHTWIGGHGAGGRVARAFATAHADRSNGLLLLGVEDEDSPLPPLLPVLIIQGSDDDVTPPENGIRLQATAPERASVKNLDGAGHLFPLDHPIETAFIIEEYLDWD